MLEIDSYIDYLAGRGQGGSSSRKCDFLMHGKQLENFENIGLTV
jgi:hypothetical protein